MGTIETFDHTADVGMRIRGDDLDDLFRTAAEGVIDYIVVNRDAVRVEALESITLDAESTLDLLVAWLNELIFRTETQRRLYSRFDVHVAADGLSLSAEIGGESIDTDRHVLDHEVKAVTQHGMSLTREGEGWLAELILDI
jgi:SHS2 domain-containing protein